jgi:hypothetical protein
MEQVWKAKLALTLDAALSNQGKFLDSQALRKYGHRLDRLLGDVETIAQGQGIADAHLPDSEIHRAILATLTNFASNVSRYYNLEVLTPDSAVAADPISTWYTQVTQPVLEAHYTERQRQRDDARTAAFAPSASTYVSVIATAETGESIRDLHDLVRRGAEAKAARPWERMYVLQLARFVTSVVSQLGRLAQAKGLPVPFLYESSTCSNSMTGTFGTGRSGP